MVAPVSGASADALIVGGGLIGCALAAELSERGLRVLVIERHEPGAEASGAAAGMLSPQAEAHGPGPFFDLALESRELYPEWSRRLFDETGLDVGFRRTGLLQCAFDPLAARQTFQSHAWQRKRGLRVEERPRETLGALAGGRLSPKVAGATFFPDEAAVDPRRLTRAAWLSAERRGAKVLAGVSATRLRIERGVCRGVETAAGSFEAGFVVDAAGAWAAFDPAVPVPVEPVRGQIVEVRLEGEPLATLLCSDDVYLVPRADGTVLVGSTVEHVGFRKEVTAEAVEMLLAAAARLLPSLASARFVAAWAGLRPGTPDGMPILGASRVPGLFFAAGHFRNGILLAPVTARRMADLLTGGAGADALAPFGYERFAGAAVRA